MIGNIRDCNSDLFLKVYTNEDSNNFTHMAPFKVLPMEVHYNTDSMANTLVIKYVASIPVVNIIMDSSEEHEIIVEYNNNIIKFQECCDGLYYYDNASTFISQVNFF